MSELIEYLLTVDSWWAVLAIFLALAPGAVALGGVSFYAIWKLVNKWWPGDR